MFRRFHHRRIPTRLLSLIAHHRSPTTGTPSLPPPTPLTVVEIGTCNSRFAGMAAFDTDLTTQRAALVHNFTTYHGSNPFSFKELIETENSAFSVFYEHYNASPAKDAIQLVNYLCGTTPTKPSITPFTNSTTSAATKINSTHFEIDPSVTNPNLKNAVTGSSELMLVLHKAGLATIDKSTLTWPTLTVTDVSLKTLLVGAHDVDEFAKVLDSVIRSQSFPNKFNRDFPKNSGKVSALNILLNEVSDCWDYPFKCNSEDRRLASAIDLITMVTQTGDERFDSLQTLDATSEAIVKSLGGGGGGVWAATDDLFVHWDDRVWTKIVAFLGAAKVSPSPDGIVELVKYLESGDVDDLIAFLAKIAGAPPTPTITHCCDEKIDDAIVLANWKTNAEAYIRAHASNAAMETAFSGAVVEIYNLQNDWPVVLDTNDIVTSTGKSQADAITFVTTSVIPSFRILNKETPASADDIPIKKILEESFMRTFKKVIITNVEKDDADNLISLVKHDPSPIGVLSTLVPNTKTLANGIEYYIAYVLYAGMYDLAMPDEIGPRKVSPADVINAINTKFTLTLDLVGEKLNV